MGTGGKVVDNDTSGQPGNNKRGGIHKPSGFFINLGFVLFDPENFGSGGLRRQGIPASIEDVVLTKTFVHLRNFVDGSGVDAVENAITQGLEVFIHGQHIGSDGAYPETLDICGGYPSCCEKRLANSGHITPPG